MTEPIELDARRLFCPLPVIRLQNCIQQQAPGTRVRITATDPGSLRDIPAWCRLFGHAVLEINESDTEFVFLVQRGADDD